MVEEKNKGRQRRKGRKKEEERKKGEGKDAKMERDGWKGGNWDMSMRN